MPVNWDPACAFCIRRPRACCQVFALLDMHRHLAASLPALDSMLRATSGIAALLGQLQALLRATASAAAVLFAEYAESVSRDGNKVLPMDGTVHPLTAQVLSYLKVRRQLLHLRPSPRCTCRATNASPASAGNCAGACGLVACIDTASCGRSAWSTRKAMNCILRSCVAAYFRLQLRAVTNGCCCCHCWLHPTTPVHLLMRCAAAAGL
jgi:hypothetical protein